MRLAAARAFAAVAAGIALAGLAVVPLWCWFLLAAAGVALVRLTRGWSLLAVLAVAALAGVRSRPASVPDERVFAARCFDGTVIEEPVEEGRDRFVVSLAPPLAGKVVLWLKPGQVRPEAGDRVRVSRQVTRFAYPRNPGLADYNRYLEARGYVGEARADQWSAAVLSRPRGPARALHALFGVRRWFSLTAYRLLPRDEAGLLLGLLVGGRQRLDRGLRQVFTDSGVVHVLAVSGFNVGVVLGVVWLLLAVLGVRGWWRFGATALAVLGYVLLVGGQASVVRAGLMALAALLAVPTQRRLEPLASLSVSGILLLLWEPRWLFDVGFQLSFLAVLTIVVAVPLVEPLLGRVRGRRLKNWLLKPLAVALAVSCSTTPLLLVHFGRVQLLTPLATLAVGPLVSLATPLGFLAVLADLASRPVAGIFAEALRVVLELLSAVVRFFGSQHWSMFAPGKVSWLAAAWLYALAGLALLWRRRWARTAVLAGLVVGLNVIAWRPAIERHQARAVFLDPVTGDALLLTDSLGRCVLVDAGVDKTGVLRDYLRAHGISTLDLAVITHPDRDHYGGLLDLDERVRIGRLVVPTLSGPADYGQLLQSLAGRGTEVVVGQSGTRLNGYGFGLELIWPEPACRRLFEQGMVETNTVSLVLLFEYSGYRMLLTGDMDDPSLLAGQELKADLLKSPHHGSRKGNLPLLYDMTKPGVVVVMGRYPTPAGLEERFAGSDVRYVNTRRDGAWILALPNRN